MNNENNAVDKKVIKKDYSTGDSEDVFIEEEEESYSESNSSFSESL